MKSALGKILVCASAMIMVLAMSTGQAQADTKGPLYWHSDLSGKCLDAQLQSIKKTLTVVQVWTCHSKKNKQWYMHRRGKTNQYTITNRQSGRCLSGQSGGANVAVVLAKCNGSTAQRWLSIYDVGGSWKYEWQNALGGRCMRAAGKSDGSRVRLKACSATDRAQRWNPT